MTSIKWTESLIQAALTAPGNLFNYRQYASVPNISWGIGLRGECDLLCLSKSGIFHEVEIKVTRSDLRRDAKKWNAHQNAVVPYSWFAVPSKLIDVAQSSLDRRFGIIEITEIEREPASEYHFSTRVVRRPKRFKHSQQLKPSTDLIIKFLRLGVMKMWTRRVPRPVTSKPKKVRS